MASVGELVYRGQQYSLFQEHCHPKATTEVNCLIHKASLVFDQRIVEKLQEIIPNLPSQHQFSNIDLYHLFARAL
jgi:hypothetical protein